MNRAKIICWAQTPRDTRDTASATLEFIVIGKQSPGSIAKEIDESGSFAVRRLFDAGEILPAPHNKTEHKAASGHGVTVVYASGKSRTVLAD